MSIEIPRALSDEVLSRYAQLRIYSGDQEVWPPELAREFRRDDMHEALRAALEGWLEPAGYRALGAPCSEGTQHIQYTHNPYTASIFLYSGLTVDQVYTLRKDKTP